MYPVCKTRDPAPENSSHKSAENGANSMSNARSVEKRFRPVRISTAFFEDQSGFKDRNSSRKTTGLSSRKPIRNIHKLLESPKRTARKRLDNLFDYPKTKENSTSTTMKSQTLSTKKNAPKTPVFTTTPGKRSDKKVEFNKHGQNSRHSRLLPPGTIAGTYVNQQNSVAPQTSLSKLSKNRLTLMQKIPQAKRPSDVPEESPPPLESPYNSSEGDKRLPLPNCTPKESTEDSKVFDSNRSINIHKGTSPINNSQDEKQNAAYCCKCSQTINESSPPEKKTESAGTSMNSKEMIKQDLTSNEDETEVVLERPTVIVMQTEVRSKKDNDNVDELVQVPVQDGSYTEILDLHLPPPNSSGIDESLLFEHTESACTRSERDGELNGADKTSESIFEIISTSNKVLIEQQKFLTDSILQYESNLKSMKLMLENVEAQLAKQKTLESSMKSKGLSIFTCEEPYVLSKKTSITSLATQAEVIDDFKTSSKAKLKANSPKAKKQRNSLKSSNAESEMQIQKGNNSTENVLGELNQEDGKKISNIENEPPQRRRSARLAMKNSDLSLPIEQSTPATGNKKSQVTKAKSTACIPSTITPARTAKWGRRSERPLREYMVLKSAVKFLNTPDSRRIRIGSDEEIRLRDSLDKTDQAFLSDKLLKELHNLYATP